jgi:hypothetical protein
MPTSLLHRLASSLLLFAAALVPVACSSSAPGPAGGAVPDAGDLHCFDHGVLKPQTVGVCQKDAPGGADAGADDGAAPAIEEPFTPLYNAEGYDDDCKYHVAFTSTPVRQNENVTFTLTLAGLDPPGPATGATPYAEVTLGDSHVSPSRDTKTVEKGAGVYEIGPIKLDRSGTWVVRFHLYGDCADTPSSPHAHVAFYVDVP